MTDDAEITAWALAAGRGDRDAAARFIRATQPRVQRFLTALVSPSEADDLAQETYLRAMRSLPSFASRSSASTWLLAIARGQPSTTSAPPALDHAPCPCSTTSTSPTPAGTGSTGRPC